MKARNLINDDKYKGKYVAFESLNDTTIIAFGDEPEKVLESARNSGKNSPVIVYIPEADRACIFDS